MSGVAPAHVRYKIEQTLLHQLVEQCWPEFQKQLSQTGRFLAGHVTREFEDNLACGRVENGFLPVSCCHKHLVASSCKRHGLCPAEYLSNYRWLDSKRYNSLGTVQMNRATKTTTITSDR